METDVSIYDYTVTKPNPLKIRRTFELQISEGGQKSLLHLH